MEENENFLKDWSELGLKGFVRNHTFSKFSISNPAKKDLQSDTLKCAYQCKQIQ
jgi:hypothetical protein